MPGELAAEERSDEPRVPSVRSNGAAAARDAGGVPSATTRGRSSLCSSFQTRRFARYAGSLGLDSPSVEATGLTFATREPWLCLFARFERRFRSKWNIWLVLAVCKYSLCDTCEAP